MRVPGVSSVLDDDVKQRMTETELASPDGLGMAPAARSEAEVVSGSEMRRFVLALCRVEVFGSAFWDEVWVSSWWEWE